MSTWKSTGRRPPLCLAHSARPAAKADPGDGYQLSAVPGGARHLAIFSCTANPRGSFPLTLAEARAKRPSRCSRIATSTTSVETPAANRSFIQSGDIV